MLSQGKTNFTVDLISCNMNNPEFISQTKNLEKNLNIKITYSLDKTGNPRSSMGDWIQESHNISIKDKYFNRNIVNWKYTLNNIIYTVNDSTNTFTLTASGDTFYISDVLLNTFTTLNTIPTNLEIDNSAILISGFIDFNFKNGLDNNINIDDLNMTDLTIQNCDFTNISLWL